jgi:prolipoprotein diacylglyceryl transferase
VPFGIVGARIYNVITSYQVYFGKGGTGALSTLYIWQGGLGIWGAVAGGAFGAWIGCRKLRIPLTFVADCLAPGLAVAQGVGRFGNWFNNELYGKATTLPWGLKVHQMDPSNQGHALVGPDGHALLLPGLYQPTFLYEVIWDFGTALIVFLADRKFKFGKGRAFALYVMVYTVGRAWIEYLRIDDANHILGLRLNDWTALIVFIGALIYFVRVRGPREYLVPEADGGYRVVTADEAQDLKALGGTDNPYAPKPAGPKAADSTDDSDDDAGPPGADPADDARGGGDPADGDPPGDVGALDETADRDAADEHHNVTK